jgi:hypothetical protein
MAYMSQERKKELAPAIKAHCKKFGVKASIAVRHHSTLVVNIKSGPIDFLRDHAETLATRPGGFRTAGYTGVDHALQSWNGYIQVNEYWLKDQHTGKALEFLEGLKELMNKGNHDNSDIMTDYFDVGWYKDINIGKWNKPYEVTK